MILLKEEEAEDLEPRPSAVVVKVTQLYTLVRSYIKNTIRSIYVLWTGRQAQREIGWKKTRVSEKEGPGVNIAAIILRPCLLYTSDAADE